MAEWPGMVPNAQNVRQVNYQPCNRQHSPNYCALLAQWLGEPESQLATRALFRGAGSHRVGLEVSGAR